MAGLDGPCRSWGGRWWYGEDNLPGAEVRSAAGGRWAPRFMLLSLLLLTGVFVWLVNYGYSAPSPGNELSLDEVYRLAAENRINSVELLDEDSQLVGETCAVVPPRPPLRRVRPESGTSGQDAAVPPRCGGPLADFHAAYPGSDLATQQLIEVLTTTTGAKVVVDKQTDVAVVRLLATYVLPLLLLANIFALVIAWRGADGMPVDMAELGSIRRSRRGKPRAGREVTFDDVAGAEEAVAELREVIDYLTDPGRFEGYGVPPPKGVLLFGPSGCGKTLLARAVVGESGVPFFWVSGRELVESLVGVGAARVRDLFRQVRNEAPTIALIEEIDALAGRGRAGAALGAEREQTVNQLLVEMDGLEAGAGVVVMAATSRPDILDPSLLRPGRFDRHVALEPPDLSARESIMKVHARNRPIAEDVDFKLLARRTPGLMGADLANVVNEGALLVSREGESDTISSSHLLEAIQRVLQRPGRRGRLMSADQRKRLAVHESGHAVVTAALGRKEELQRVSVIARGRGLPRSVASSDSDRLVLSAKELKEQLTMAMGGTAAEQLVFGEASTIGEDDIERATFLARQMVGLYGMSSAVGRLRLLTEKNGYAGSGEVVGDSVSGQTREQFDREVKGLLAEAERTANMMLLRHRSNLEGMASRLDIEETLEGAALETRLARVRDG